MKILFTISVLLFYLNSFSQTHTFGFRGNSGLSVNRSNRYNSYEDTYSIFSKRNFENGTFMKNGEFGFGFSYENKLNDKWSLLLCLDYMQEIYEYYIDVSTYFDEPYVHSNIIFLGRNMSRLGIKRNLKLGDSRWMLSPYFSVMFSTRFWGTEFKSLFQMEEREISEGVEEVLGSYYIASFAYDNTKMKWTPGFTIDYNLNNNFSLELDVSCHLYQTFSYEFIQQSTVRLSEYPHPTLFQDIIERYENDLRVFNVNIGFGLKYTLKNKERESSK